MKILVPIALSVALSLAATLIALVTSRLITRAAFRTQPPDEEAAVEELALPI